VDFNICTTTISSSPVREPQHKKKTQSLHSKRNRSFHAFYRDTSQIKEKRKARHLLTNTPFHLLRLFSFDLDNLFVALGGNWRFSFLVEQHGRHRDDKRNQVRRRHSGIFIIVRASLRAISDFAVNVATQRTLEQSAAVRVNFN